MAGKLRRINRLTQERLKEVLHYDPETGIFTSLVKRGRGKHQAQVGSIVGTQKGDGYVSICIDKEQHRGHRLAWFYMTGRWPYPECDHKNLIRSDNRWENLREASVKQQRQNQSVRSDNKVGLKGVRWNERKQRFTAKITVNGKAMWLGQGFTTAEEAHAAYVAAKAKYHTFQPTIPVKA